MRGVGPSRDRDDVVETLLARLDRVIPRSGGWVARCPAHQDEHPSLSLKRGADGRVLVHCRAGCLTEDVLSAVGLTMADLFAEVEPRSRMVSTYDYRDEHDERLYQICRFEPKDFRARRSDGAGGWIWNLRGVRRVLYRLPELVVASPASRVLVVEGEKDADRLAALGLLATTNVGGAGKWRPECAAFLDGQHVVILPDNDDPGRKHAELVAASLAGIAAAVSIIELPGLRPKGDVSEWLDAGGTAEELLTLIDTVNHAADGRDQVALAEAQPTELPTMTLAETLGATVAHLTRFVHFARPEHADAVALWTAHTHAALERLGQSPILALTSAVKQSGKTRVLDVLEFLVRTPWRITRPSESVLFRKIDKDHPTVLLDEIDAIFGDKTSTTEGIRSLFNSGNRRGTKVPRNVAQGKTFALVEFDVFCPKATAGIGGLPDTILDRAIVIEMERRTRGERVERLRERTARAFGTPLRDGLADHIGRLEDFTVVDAALPSELDDRAQDGWEPLVAIADAAGGDWPARARRAAVAIFGARSVADENLGLRLLVDCREVFEGRVEDFLPTAEMRTALIALDQSAWADIRGREITAHYLGKLLRAFDIESKRSRPSGVGNPVHGYFRADFRDAWKRYASVPEQSGTSGTSGTTDDSGPRSAARPVPDVPDVPDARPMTDAERREAVAAARWIFGDGDDYVVGTA